MSLQTQIVEALAQYGVTEVAFYDIDETSLTAIRLTDHDYRDHEVVQMIAYDILSPMGVDISSYGSNAFYATDEKKGAVIVVRGLH